MAKQRKRKRMHQRHDSTNEIQILNQHFEVWYGECRKTGMGALLVALACISIHAQVFWALVGVAGVTLAHDFSKLPPELRELRRLAKRHPAAKQQLAWMLHKYLGVHALFTRNGIFLLGYVVLMLVALNPLITHGYPFTRPLLNMLLQ
jgi:hypothetical protein